MIRANILTAGIPSGQFNEVYAITRNAADSADSLHGVHSNGNYWSDNTNVYQFTGTYFSCVRSNNLLTFTASQACKILTCINGVNQIKDYAANETIATFDMFGETDANALIVAF
jgi:hypothetical protein